MGYKNLNAFTYIEKLDSETLSLFPETLVLDRSPTSEAILLRLLLGTLNLKLESQTEILHQNLCYSKMRDEFEDDDPKDHLSEWINNNFGLGDLDNYLKIGRRNKTLFDELLTEFSFYFIYKNKSNHISAFLHLYRALEFMSYSFPMTYSSKTSNFYTSFDIFKSFFTSKEQGQLKFFQEFVRVLFEKGTLQCRLKIDTFVGEEILDKVKAKVVRRLCKDFDSYDDGYVISIEYKNLLDFMVNLRNRYFHFHSDRTDNISNINFDSELFFSALNDKFANWLAMIYLEIVIHGVYKLNLIPTR